MADDITESAELADLRAALRPWRQGDYTLSNNDFPVAFLNENGVLETEWDTVRGWVVVSQTCDIVNVADIQDGVVKDVVVIAPIVEASSEKFVEDVRAGTTTVGAILENAELPSDIVDLRFLASVRKTTLAKMERIEGFTSDRTRDAFVNALERRYGRFAFPDDLSNGPIITIRNRAKAMRKKQGSDINLVYRSLRSIRVSADPDFDTVGAKIQFLLVLEDKPLVEPKAIVEELEGQAKTSRFNWPASFEKQEPFFRVVTMDGISAREWDGSRHVDLDFISWANVAPSA